MALPTYGSMAVDWEQRINFDRLRTRAPGPRQGTLQEVGDGRAARLRHEQRPLPDRHHIGTWAQDKISRFALLAAK